MCSVVQTLSLLPKLPPWILSIMLPISSHQLECPSRASLIFTLPSVESSASVEQFLATILADGEHFSSESSGDDSTSDGVQSGSSPACQSSSDDEEPPSQPRNSTPSLRRASPSESPASSATRSPQTVSVKKRQCDSCGLTRVLSVCSRNHAKCRGCNVSCAGCAPRSTRGGT